MEDPFCREYSLIFVFCFSMWFRVGPEEERVSEVLAS
jgi:hypothetical protein